MLKVHFPFHFFFQNYRKVHICFVCNDSPLIAMQGCVCVCVFVCAICLFWCMGYLLLYLLLVTSFSLSDCRLTNVWVQLEWELNMCQCCILENYFIAGNMALANIFETGATWTEKAEKQSSRVPFCLKDREPTTARMIVDIQRWLRSKVSVKMVKNVPFHPSVMFPSLQS